MTEFENLEKWKAVASRVSIFAIMRENFEDEVETLYGNRELTEKWLRACRDAIDLVRSDEPADLFSEVERVTAERDALLAEIAPLRKIWERIRSLVDVEIKA